MWSRLLFDILLLHGRTGFVPPCPAPISLNRFLQGKLYRSNLWRNIPCKHRHRSSRRVGAASIHRGHSGELDPRPKTEGHRERRPERVCPGASLPRGAGECKQRKACRGQDAPSGERASVEVLRHQVRAPAAFSKWNPGGRVGANPRARGSRMARHWARFRPARWHYDTGKGEHPSGRTRVNVFKLCSRLNFRLLFGIWW